MQLEKGMATYHKAGPKAFGAGRSTISPLAVFGILLIVMLAVLPNSPTSALSALPGSPHTLTKRSYFDINCKGVYDKSIFARLDRICQDCYSLYREPELHSLCRSECFSTPFFKACLKVLMMEDQDTDFSILIDKIGR